MGSSGMPRRVAPLCVALSIACTGVALAQSTFDELCRAPGVVRCYGFEDENDLLRGDPNSTHGPSRMKNPGSGGSDKYKLCTETPGDRCWMLDSGIKASGETSLRFEIPSNSGADSSGSFRLNFSDDFSKLLKPGTGFDEVWIQFRQRFSPDMLRQWESGGGWKQMILGRGDRNAGDFATSCTTEEMVLVQKESFQGPSFYHACGVFDNLQVTPPELPDGVCPGSSPIAYQHVSDPWCCRNDTAGCFRYAANEWMTFRIHLKVAGWNRNPGNFVEVHAAREGQPSVKVFDSRISDPDGLRIYPSENPNYGKIWFLTYNTGKSTSDAHPTAFTWYDDLIISTTPIPDPSFELPSDPPPIPQNLIIKGEGEGP